MTLTQKLGSVNYYTKITVSVIRYNFQRIGCHESWPRFEDNHKDYKVSMESKVSMISEDYNVS